MAATPSWRQGFHRNCKEAFQPRVHCQGSLGMSKNDTVTGFCLSLLILESLFPWQRQVYNVPKALGHHGISDSYVVLYLVTTKFHLADKKQEVIYGPSFWFFDRWTTFLSWGCIVTQWLPWCWDFSCSVEVYSKHWWNTYICSGNPLLRTYGVGALWGKALMGEAGGTSLRS